MPFFKAIKSNSFVGFKRKGNLDLDFLNVFTGTMDNVWSWGQTHNGNTGQSASSPSQTPYYASHKFSKIYNQWDAANSMGIKADGTLWGWGENSQGQLGLGDTTARTSPVQVGSRNDWLKVAPGNNGYTHMLRTDGVLFGTGYNLTWTMLGDGTNTNRSSPVQIGTGFSDIMNGYSHSIACKSDGTLWSWGAGLFGSGLGDGTSYTWSGNFNDGSGSRNYPLQIGSGGFNSVFANASTSGAAKSDGYLYSWAGSPWGTSGSTPTQSTINGTGWSGCNFIQGSAGQSVFAIIKSNGTLWMCGSNTYGSLGQGDTTSYSSAKQVGSDANWFSAAVIQETVFATTTDRKMFSWGRNGSSQILALGDTNSRSSPVQIGTRRRWGILAGVAGAAGFQNNGTITYVLAADT